MHQEFQQCIKMKIILQKWNKNGMSEQILNSNYIRKKKRNK